MIVSLFPVNAIWVNSYNRRSSPHAHYASVNPTCIRRSLSGVMNDDVCSGAADFSNGSHHLTHFAIVVFLCIMHPSEDIPDDQIRLNVVDNIYYCL